MSELQNLTWSFPVAEIKGFVEDLMVFIGPVIYFIGGLFMAEAIIRMMFRIIRRATGGGIGGGFGGGGGGGGLGSVGGSGGSLGSVGGSGGGDPLGGLAGSSGGLGNAPLSSSVGGGLLNHLLESLGKSARKVLKSRLRKRRGDQSASTANDAAVSNDDGTPVDGSVADTPIPFSEEYYGIPSFIPDSSGSIADEDEYSPGYQVVPRSDGLFDFIDAPVANDDYDPYWDDPDNDDVYDDDYDDDEW